MRKLFRNFAIVSLGCAAMLLPKGPGGQDAKFDSDTIFRIGSSEHRLRHDERTHLGADGGEGRWAHHGYTSARRAEACGSPRMAGRPTSQCLTRPPRNRSAPITIDPQNPKTIWVGTGESWNAQQRFDRRRHLQIGGRRRQLDKYGPAELGTDFEDYRRSERAATQFTPAYRENCGATATIAGLYKTTDGGKTWKQNS